MTIKKPTSITRIPHNREPYQILETLTEKDCLDHKTIRRIDQITDPKISTHELIKTVLDADSAKFTIHQTHKQSGSETNVIKK